MNIQVRRYEKEDLDSVNSLLEESFFCKKSNFHEDNIIELVVTDDNDVCGYLMLTIVKNPIRNIFYALVDYVCIASNKRGLGIGSNLMQYAYLIAKEENCQYLQLTCSYFREAAHKLYEREGYIKRESDIFRKEIV